VLTEYGFSPDIGGLHHDLKLAGQRYLRNRADFWVAELDGALVGTVAVRPKDEITPFAYGGEHFELSIQLAVVPARYSSESRKVSPALRFRRRQAHAYRRAGADVARNVDRTAVGLDDPSGKSQTQADTACPSRATSLCAKEWLEHVWQVVRSDPHPLIAYCEFHPSAACTHSELDGTSRVRRIFVCVLEEVIDGPAEEDGVDENVR
jgi:hypothetical protein